MLNIAIGSAGRIAPRLPNPRFTRRLDRCLKTRRSLLPIGAGRSLRPFPRLQRLAFAKSMAGSTVPTYCFAPSLTASRARSARISTTETGLPRSRQLPRPKPVARSTTRAPDGVLRSHSPSGLLHPFGSKLPQDLPPSGPPSDSPDLRSLPEGVSIARPAFGSPFAVRYVSEACCFSNLLEPLSLCARTLRTSNRFWGWRALFLNFFRLYFLMVWKKAGVD